jgi:YegS/Rv2252/BmrU family lipid kinase
MDRVLLIANPAAGLRSRHGLLESLRRRLEADGIGAELHETEGPRDAIQAARAAASSGRFDALLAVGGDGTVHEVANGLVGTTLPMGVVPAGTMNLLARELGLPLDPLQSIDGLGRFRAVPFTTGRAGERHFILMAGVGLDAYALGLALERAGSGKVTFAGYVLAGVTAASRFSYQGLEVVADGERLSATSVIIGNVRRYGGNLRITPQADPLDPFLDLCLFQGTGPLSYVGAFVGILAGGRHLGRRDVAYRKVRRIEIHHLPGEAARARERPVPIQMDGEQAGNAPVLLESCPESVRVLAPPSWRR